MMALLAADMGFLLLWIFAIQKPRRWTCLTRRWAEKPLGVRPWESVLPRGFRRNPCHSWWAGCQKIRPNLLAQTRGFSRTEEGGEITTLHRNRQAIRAEALKAVRTRMFWELITEQRGR